MTETEGPFRIELDEELEDGQVVAVDAAGNVIARISGKEMPPPGTHTLRLSPEAFDRLWSFTRDRSSQRH